MDFNKELLKEYMETCPICNEPFYYTDEDIWFDDKSCGYSVKLVKCPRCEGIRRLQYYEDPNLDVNNDERFYNYSRNRF